MLLTSLVIFQKFCNFFVVFIIVLILVITCNFIGFSLIRKPLLIINRYLALFISSNSRDLKFGKVNGSLFLTI